MALTAGSRIGRSIAFQSDREGDLAIYRQPADGGPATRLTKAAPNASHIPDAWTLDGRHLLFEEEEAEVAPIERKLESRKTPTRTGNGASVKID